MYYEVGISTSINTGGAWANQYGYNSMHNPSAANNYISSQLLYGFDVTNTTTNLIKIRLYTDDTGATTIAGTERSRLTFHRIG